MEIGLKVAANFGALVPYLDLSYNAEDTTAAAYKSEAGTDGGALDLAASDGDNSYTIGGGMNFMIGNHLSGGVRFGNTNGIIGIQYLIKASSWDPLPHRPTPQPVMNILKHNGHNHNKQIWR